MRDIKTQSTKNKTDYPSSNKASHKRRFSSVFYFMLASLLFGVVGGVLGQQYLSPYVVSLSGVDESGAISSGSGEVVIQKTEIFEVKDSEKLENAIQKMSPALVSIYSSDDVSTVIEGVQKIDNASSGFIVTADGLIVSSGHFVDEEKDYFVRINDGEVFPVVQIEKDSLLDLAYFKIDAGNLPVVEFGISADVMVGEGVVVFGNKALDRTPQLFTDIIASDSFTLGGNTDMLALSSEYDSSVSGAPLSGLDGKVIGILSYEEKDGVAEQYVIPIDYIKDVMRVGIGSGSLLRPTIPFEYLEITPEFAMMNNMSIEYGALITGLISAESDFEVGDIVTKIDGEELTAQTSFTATFFTIVNIDVSELTVLRDGEEKVIEISSIDTE